MEKVIKIGDKVLWMNKTVRIVRIEIRPKGDRKYGKNVDVVRNCDKHRCVFDFDNDHWAYGSQIKDGVVTC